MGVSVGALDGFYSTWSQARQTYGEGPPATGERFDASSTLNQLKSDMDAAKPEGRWSGKASEAYGTANAQHQQVIGRIGELDQKLAAQVNNASALVSNGRTQLDELKTWVTNAAASTTNDQAGRTVQMQIAKQGLARLTEIMTGTHGEMQTVKGNITTIQAGYDELKQDMRFAKEDKGDADPLKENEEKPPEMHALPPEEQARRDVEDALAGDQGAAGRVEETLSSIKPGQDLSPQQDAYLSQMQSQQKGMSVDELTTAEQRLGDHKNVIADSWQLMSNDDVKFSGSDGKPGSAAMLPDSVQKTLEQADVLSGNRGGDIKLVHADDLNQISAIVKDGNVDLQTGTELDREMLRASDRVMDKYFPSQIPTEAHTEVAQNIFESAGRDHQIVHDHMLGTHGDDGDDFLHDINSIDWPDDGKAARSLVDWTNEASSGPQSDIASATAEKYATYLGDHKDQLMAMNGGQSLGELNPELTRGYAHGLTPYMADIASFSSGNNGDHFGMLDPGDPERPVAKGLFSVLATDEHAYAEFNGAADQMALDRAMQYAEDVKHGVPVEGNDSRLLEGAVLKGLVASGSAEAAHALTLSDAQAAEWRKNAYEAGVAGLSSVAGPAGGAAVGAFGALMEDSMIGPPIDTTRPVVPDLPAEESARFVLNALLADGVKVDGIDPRYMVDGRIASLQELQNSDALPADIDMQENLNKALENAVGTANSPAEEFARKYGQIVKDPNP